ncbi:immunoglobulin-like domain-containing receptor 2 isoform X1 [Ochotona princeps]|uniref:immunoglobulin-like domain-containing receptor 2 isoform X1 n=1 Tax=Ochotona princeps TaxID=9978 RepID=UPI00271482BE|nr:immunoglobulin-like domain-containing receptor 2 isoform X1 [Ochotona princeps]
MRRRAPRRSPSPRQRALQAARPGARLRQRERPGGWWAAGGGAQGRPVPAGARGYRPAAARRGGLPTNRAFQPLPALLTSDLHGKLGAMDRVVLAWVALFWLTAMVEGLQVTVPDKKKIAMLFQPTVLRCHFSTSSHQPAVVQWKFKSYCQDRMGESLGMSSTRIQSLSKRNLEWDPYLDCLDSRRTVRVVASKQGSTVTLGEFYRGREITIVHDADLQIGKLMWGDSGLYYCIITTPDDLEGKNEDSVEVLVLGRTGLLADLLPSFAVEIMPEWVFIGLVILGIFLFFVLVGICWCQCCPHSCCCYVRCPCCPDSCCCPQALYEAGKAAKAGYPPSVAGVPGPYSIPSVPLGGAPSSGMLMDKPHPPPLAPSDSTGGSHSVRKGYRIQADKERDSMKVLYYVEKELAQFDPARRMRGRYNNTISELSSLHEEDSNFRQSYHQMRSKQFPVSGDLESNPDYWSGVMGGSSGASRGPSALEYNKEDRENFRHSQQRSKSEMLSRKNFATGVPAVSMDELAAFADSYGQRPRRANGNSHEARGGSRFERSESRAHGPFYQDSSLEEYYGPRSRSRSREPLTDAERGWSYSPPRRRPAEDAHLPRLVSRTPGTAPKYDHSYLSSVLERQSRPEAASRGGSLETPSKLSARLGPRSASYYAWSPPSTYKAGAAQGADDDDDDDDEDDDDDGDAPDDALPPYSERELSRGPSYRSRDLSFHSNSEKRRKKEPAKKTNDFPTRMSLVV